VRVTTAFNRLLALEGISVVEVSFTGTASVMLDVALRRRRLVCPMCSFSTWARYDTRAVASTWRHLDFGRWQVFVRAGLRRLRCPEHGVRVEGVPFARARSRFSRDFEDLVAFLATKTDKRTIARLSRVDWDTVGRICERVVAHGLDPERLDGLVNIGVDEVSWRRHHNYLTLVAEHTSKKIVWARRARTPPPWTPSSTTSGPERAAQLQAVSMDMGAAFNKSVRAPDHAPQAVICIDPFHGCPTGHRRPGRRAPRRMERTTSPTRPGRGQKVQRRPLGAAQTAREPQRRPVRHPAKTAPPRRERLARLHPSIKRPSAPSSPATWTPTTRARCSTGGAPRPPARACPRSSGSPKPSASTARGSWRPSSSQ